MRYKINLLLFYSSLAMINPPVFGQEALEHIQQGIAWYQKGDFDRAIGAYNEAIHVDPKNTSAYHNRGLAWISKGDQDKAIADFTRALMLAPMQAESYYSRGKIRDRRGELEKAIADYDDAIRHGLRDARVYIDRGVCLADKGETDRALADFNDAIKLDPKAALAYNNRAIVWLRRGIFDRALADFEKAISFDRREALAYNGQAWIWATSPEAKYRNGERAVESATQACELAGFRDFDFLVTLAASHAEVGNYKAAIDMQKKALDLIPEGNNRRESELNRLKLYNDNKPFRDTP